MVSRAAPVVVGEGEAPGAGERDSLQDAVMDQFIVKDEILGAEQMADGGDVGGVSADQNNGVVYAISFGDSLFEFAMNGTFSGYERGWRRPMCRSGRWLPWRPH